MNHTSEAKRIEEKYAELDALVDAFIKELYKEWAANVGAASKFNLNQNLITRNAKNKLIQLNFHPQVCTLLRLKISPMLNHFPARNRPS